MGTCAANAAGPAHGPTKSDAWRSVRREAVCFAPMLHMPFPSHGAPSRSALPGVQTSIRSTSVSSWMLGRTDMRRRQARGLWGLTFWDRFFGRCCWLRDVALCCLISDRSLDRMPRTSTVDAFCSMGAICFRGSSTACGTCVVLHISAGECPGRKIWRPWRTC